MTKIYEALENASRERAVATGAPTPSLTTSALPKSLTEKLLSLAKRLETLVRVPDGRIIEVVSVAGSRQESSRISQELAGLAARRLQRRVLLLAISPTPDKRKRLPQVPPKTWEDVARGMCSLEEVVHEVDENLCVSMMASSDAALSGVLASEQVKSALDSVRRDFDLVLIDSPPLAESSDALLLSSLGDGIVLVVQARKTRWPVIRYWLDQISSQGGNILGVILNGQRRYIPDFIYRKLL